VEPRTTAMVNIGILLTGDLTGPISDADSLLIERGTITAIGGVDTSTADRTIDVGGATVGPGLIDSHCHVVLGDYTPRQNTVGFLSSYVHGGIVQAISAGEIHTPGRPTDRVGGKALAVASRHWWDGYRPNGMKVHGGSVVIEPDLTDEDFLEIAGQGVWLAKFGFGRYADPADGLPQVRAAQAAGIKVMAGLLKRRSRLGYILTVALLAVMILASLLDDFGLADLLFVLVTLMPLALLIKDRAWYVRPSLDGQQAQPGA